MAKAADAQDGDDVAWSRYAVTQRVEGRYAGVHQWSGLFKREFVGNARECADRNDRIIGISAIVGNSRNLHIDARVEIAATAAIAGSIVSTVPSDADAFTDVPTDHIRTGCVNGACDFVTGHSRIRDSRPDFMDRKKVAVANPVRVYSNADLSGTGISDRNVR